ncbi:cellulase family glycosylhydrolase [Fulvivirga ulvae]|uniref:cellulase family glycosylhydrolase n=1 Tax=Fulvivirga ulvae TaxID=2904245 RepID=UPI001F478A60|nr:cellulase family glycosylhydrolase [Fulvivirga ulvae]UII34507.1 cellulase family glycosylhydrolase [Fulvivirga ulvae]
MIKINSYELSVLPKSGSTDVFKSRLKMFVNSRRSFILLVCGVMMSLTVYSQLPTAQQVAANMKVGWNLGNTLEAIGGETSWGNPMANQQLINSVKAAGFNTVRLPVSWDQYANQSNNQIDAAWMARVKEVVDYCISNDLYVILNIHWDNGWLEENVTTAQQQAVNVKQNAYWTQIANYFKAYNEHLLFASANEPRVEDATGMSVLLSYHQTFVNAVRATGGNNSSRTLIVQGPKTDIGTTNELMNTLPTDQIANRMMVEVHYYDPYQFCLMDNDESWGNVFYYWGNGYHSSTNTSRNANWGEESHVDERFGLMKAKFVDQGIPVIIGEFAAKKRSGIPEESLHIASREYYHKYVVQSAIDHGMIPVYWDHGQPEFGLFNRSTGAVVDQGNLDAIMEGAAGSCTPTQITPYVQLNGGPWAQTSSANLDAGGSVKFGPQPTRGGSWSWRGPNSFSATTREVTIANIQSNQAGDYVATYTNTAGCSSTNTFKVTINSSASSIVVRARGTQGDETIELRVGSQTVATWTLGTSYANYTASGNGAVSVHFTNDNGGRDVQIDYVTVGGTTYQSENQSTNTGVWQNSSCGGSNSEWLNCNGYISYATTGSSSARTAQAESGVSNVEEIVDIVIYPNPSREGNFSITVPKAMENATIHVFDNKGRQVYENVAERSGTFDINTNLKAGVYLVKLTSGKANLTKKLIVR